MIANASAGLLALALFCAGLVVAAARAFDLVSFLLLVISGGGLALAVWRGHTLYLLVARLRCGVSAPASPSDPLSRLAALPIWDDRLLISLLAAALIANLLIFGYVSASFGALPPFLPLHYSASGDVDRLGTPPEVFMMPGIGVVVQAANLMFGAVLYRRERLASYLLSAASIFVQLELLVATVQIVSRA